MRARRKIEENNLDGRVEKRRRARCDERIRIKTRAMSVSVCIRFVLSLVLILTYGVQTRHFEGTAADVFQVAKVRSQSGPKRRVDDVFQSSFFAHVHDKRR
jgi:hypothetical protein